MYFVTSSDVVNLSIASATDEAVSLGKAIDQLACPEKSAHAV